MVKLLPETGKIGDGIQKIDNDLNFEWAKFEYVQSQEYTSRKTQEAFGHKCVGPEGEV